jgi:hypothetical protein
VLSFAILPHPRLIFKVYDTISSFPKRSAVFDRTEKSVHALNNVLLQIKELAHESHRPEVSPINRTKSLTHSHKDFFQSLQNAVQICVDELDPLAKKLSQWKATQDTKQWLKKITNTLSVYIKSSDLREIDELVSKHVRDERKIDAVGKGHLANL